MEWKSHVMCDDTQNWQLVQPIKMSALESTTAKIRVEFSPDTCQYNWRKKKDYWNGLSLLVSPSVSDSRILFECGTEGGYLLSTTLQHVIPHISLEGAVEVLKGIHFIQGEDLVTDDMTERQHESHLNNI